MELVYLASPYGHKDEAVREYRYHMACSAAAYLISKGYAVFSPIAHSHGVARFIGNPNNTKFWLEQDLIILERCERFAILRISGWDKSKGILVERREYVGGKPIIYLSPSGKGYNEWIIQIS